jgi:hypothetical protein
MIFTNLDTCANRFLLGRRYPKHWYVETLVHMSACLRELTFDTLQIINSAVLTPNKAGQAYLPQDFVDECGLYIATGQKLSQVPHRDDITPLINYNTTGQPVPYSDNAQDPQQTTLPFNWPGGNWYWNVNDLGENIGRMFGYDTTLFNPNGYKIFKERGQVQLLESFTENTYVLLYISDGQTIDNASQITPYAINTLEANTDWKMSKNRANDMSPEGLTYKRARKGLRSRLSDISSLLDIKEIIRANYQDAPKT